MTKAKAQIEKILNDEYGIGMARASGNVGLWAAEQCDNPKEALKALNKILDKNGAPLCHAPYGHPAF